MPSHLLVGLNRQNAWIQAIFWSDRTVLIGHPRVSRCPLSNPIIGTRKGSLADGSKAVPGGPLVVSTADDSSV